MTETLEKKCAKFKFFDDFQRVEDEYCEINVTVEKKKYESGELFYYINYNSELSKNNKRCKRMNPLLSISDDSEEIYEGDIIAVNSLTEKMIEYLLMPYNVLQNYSGHTTPQQYKIQIIQSIKLFWD